MTKALSNAAHGTLSDPATLTLKRLLPGPIEKVWAYLTEADLRSRWLAGGAMDPRVGTGFELVWRNDELASRPGQRPEGFAPEQRMRSVITEWEPPHRLSFSWNDLGEVSFLLERQGTDVLLTLVHRRIADRTEQLMVGPGWHAHLDILIARLSGEDPDPFWDRWTRLRAEYDARLPG